MDAELIERIRAVASGPAEVSSDAGRVVEQNLEDLLEAARQLAAQASAAKPHRGLRFTRLVPPGTI